MNKNKKIINLFSKTFPSSNFYQKSRIDNFYCQNQKDCRVNLAKEATYTPYLGDVNTSVMVIAEAPSVTCGKGAYIGGSFSDLEVTNKSPIHIVRDFCQKNFNTIPYFTDLVKCGIEKQQNKKLLNIRYKNCIEHFLLKEIQIIEPEYILCIGKTSYDFMVEYKKNGKIKEPIKIFNLLHYSRRAMLPLSDKDKIDLVWKIQTGIIGKGDLFKISIGELSYFKSYKF
jgi:hypothetical protein